MDMRFKYLLLVLAGLLVLGIWSCGKEDSVINVKKVFGNAVLLRPWNLPTLDEDSKNCYELWIVKELFTADANGDDTNVIEAELSLGRFLWDRINYRFYTVDGQRRDSVFSTPQDQNIYDYNAIMITVESLSDDGIRSLNGLTFDYIEYGQPIHGQFNFYDPISEEAVYHFEDPMEADFSLRIHSQTGRGQRSASGLWFCSSPSQVNCSVEKSMSLPVLRPEAGFAYEGWIERPGYFPEPISTGKFKNPGFEDWSNPYIGSQAYPNIPGEDFLRNAPANFTFPTSLVGEGMVYISLEPYPDPDPNNRFPFVLFSSPLPSDTLNICGTTTMHNGYDRLPAFDAVVLDL